jgi:glycosyltransferase involved in cell wall biosynthesis
VKIINNKTQQITPKIVCFPFVGDAVGGSHVSALELIWAMDRKNYIPLIVLHKRGPFSDYLEANNTEFIVLSGNVEIIENVKLIQQMGQMWACSQELCSFLREQNISIVHTNDLRMHMTWLVACKRARCKMIWHQRTPEDSRRNAIYSRLASRVLTVSEFCKNSFAGSMEFRAITIWDPVKTVFEEVEKNRCREVLLQAAGNQHQGLIVSFISNFMARKRPGVFVDVAALVLKKLNIPVSFYLFGEMREPIAAQVIDKIRALDLEDSVFCMGTKHPIEPWISASDIIAAPAVGEGLGRVLIEAQQLGVPVVATKDAGHCEIISHNKTGFLIDIEDTVGFADQICMLLSNTDKRQSVISAAREDAQSRFSVQNHCNSIQQIYDSVTERH